MDGIGRQRFFKLKTAKVFFGEGSPTAHSKCYPKLRHILRDHPLSSFVVLQNMPKLKRGVTSKHGVVHYHVVKQCSGTRCSREIHRQVANQDMKAEIDCI
jgi:hypothetical protein